MASLVSSGFRPPCSSSSGGSALNPTTMTGVVTTPAAASSAMASSGGPTSNPGGIGGQNILGSAASGVASSFKPVPMKLFATWEVDRTPPNCIPR